MKKIKNYLLTLVCVLVGAFVFGEEVLFAEENITITNVIVDEKDEYLVVNPTSEGDASYKFSGKQYISYKNISILAKEKLISSSYDRSYKICEKVIVTENNETKEVDSNCTTITLNDNVNTFEIKSKEDGEKTLRMYFYSNGEEVEIIEKKLWLDTYDKDDVYVVVNPTSDGNPSDKYNGVQYSNNRWNYFIVQDSSILETYDKEFKICEQIEVINGNKKETSESCVSFDIDDKKKGLQIQSENDGDKTYKIMFYKDGKVINEVKKTIHLDTTAPVITLRGGSFVFVHEGNEYREQGAYCTDDNNVMETTCVVKEENIVDSSNKGYKTKTYVAEDFLGNVSVVNRTIITEVKEEKKVSPYLIGGIVGVVALAALFGIKIWKEKEKRKNQSLL